MEIKKYLAILIGIAIGLIGGFFYWMKVGCVTGSCSITANPINSTIYGGIMGGLLSSILINSKRDNKKKQ